MNKEQKNKALYEISKVLSDIEKFANSDDEFSSIDYYFFIDSIGGNSELLGRLSCKREDLTINYVILLLSKMMVELSVGDLK